MIGSNQYGSVEYGGQSIIGLITLNLSDAITSADTLAIIIPLNIMDVVGASDAVSTTPDQMILADTVRLNDWVRLEKKPANSQFTGE